LEFVVYISKKSIWYIQEGTHSNTHRSNCVYKIQCCDTLKSTMFTKLDDVLQKVHFLEITF